MNETEYDAAVVRFEQLTRPGHVRSEAELVELKTVLAQIVTYEDEHYPMPVPDSQKN